MPADVQRDYKVQNLHIAPGATPERAPFKIDPAAQPTSTVGEGSFNWNDTANVLEGYDGTQWRKFADRYLVTANLPLNGDCVDQAIFIADRAYKVLACYEIHATAGNDAGAVNVQLVKDTSTDAPGAGTNLLTNNTNAGFDLKGTANTLQTGTLTATAASLALAAGNRLSLDFAGTITTLAGVQVTVVLEAV